MIQMNNLKNNEKNDTSSMGYDTLLHAIKNNRLKDWFYYFKNGHKFLLSEEVDIICNTRADDKYKWMNDDQIQKLIRVRVKEMYKKKYPNAKRWSLDCF